jgi:hypothetical protein
MLLPIPVRHLSAIPLALLLGTGHGVRQSSQTTISVRGFDFALEMPDTIPAGTHVWAFRNDGKSRHEFILARLRSGTDTKAVVDSLHARGLRAFFGSEASAILLGGLFAEPGMAAAAEFMTHDRRGEVLLVFCQFRDAPDKPKHDDLGMFKVVHVR